MGIGSDYPLLWKPSKQYMYFIYLVMYGFIVFFTLMNFFLAIVVDAFIEVKQEIEKQLTERTFPFDSD